MTDATISQALTPFQDASGHLAALDGCAPARLSRRVAARLLDTGILMGIGLIAYLPALAVSFGPRTYTAVQWQSGLTLLAQLVWAAASLGYLVMLGLTGFMPGGRILGIRQVNIVGKAPGIAALGKYALEALLNVFTCNIGLIISFAIIKPPLNRAWYDVASGLVVLDIRVGRDPLAAPATSPVTAAVTREVVRESVVNVGSGSHSVVSDGSEAGSLVTDETSLAAPLLTPASPAPSVKPPVARQAPVTSVDGDEMITGVPWHKPESAPFEPVPDLVAPRTFQPSPVQAGPAMAVPLHEELDDRTVVSLEPIVPVGGRATLALVSDDGVRILLDKVTVLGRNPSAPQGHENARLHPLPDTTMSVSKTHALVGPDPDGLWVQDLRSTNGTAITTANGIRTAVPAGGRVVAARGSIVHIGKLAFHVTEQ